MHRHLPLSRRTICHRTPDRGAGWRFYVSSLSRFSTNFQKWVPRDPNPQPIPETGPDNPQSGSVLHRVRCAYRCPQRLKAFCHRAPNSMPPTSTAASISSSVGRSRSSAMLGSIGADGRVHTRLCQAAHSRRQQQPALAARLLG
jgi:hypothetical protein